MQCCSIQDPVNLQMEHDLSVPIQCNILTSELSDLSNSPLLNFRLDRISTCGIKFPLIYSMSKSKAMSFILEDVT